MKNEMDEKIESTMIIKQKPWKLKVVVTRSLAMEIEKRREQKTPKLLREYSIQTFEIKGKQS